MGTIEFKGITEYQKQLDELGKKGADAAIRYAIYRPAGMVLEEIKKNTPVDTGDLRDSVTLSRMKEKDGFIYTQIMFVGYDRKGAPNVVKARVLESGRSGSKTGKHPFVRKSVNAVKKKLCRLCKPTLTAIFTRN